MGVRIIKVEIWKVCSDWSAECTLVTREETEGLIKNQISTMAERTWVWRTGGEGLGVSIENLHI